MFIYAFSYGFYKMASVSVLQKMINVMYGALIFLILVGILVVVYNIFWAEKPGVPEQNLDSVFAELKQLEKGSCFEVVIRPFEESYSLILHAWGNELCRAPCLALDIGDAKPRPLVWAEKSCAKGPCVNEKSAVAVPANTNKMISVCRNKDNELFIK